MGLFVCLLVDFKASALEWKRCTQEHPNPLVIAEQDSSSADFLGKMNVYSFYSPSKRMQVGLTGAAQQKVAKSRKNSVLQQTLLYI